MSVGWLGGALTSQYYRDWDRDKMQTVLSHSSPDYRCNKPGCSCSGINIIEKREFTPDRPEDESDKKEDISTDSTRLTLKAA